MSGFETPQFAVVTAKASSDILSKSLQEPVDSSPSQAWGCCHKGTKPNDVMWPLNKLLLLTLLRRHQATTIDNIDYCLLVGYIS